MTVIASGLLHLTPDDYHLIRAEDFGAPGLSARESVGPFTSVEALGVLVTVHDSRFDPRCGIGHHPHRGMERLFYILDGSVDHDDVRNGISGHMATGDLGILTEGQRGMLHSEWNNGDGPARAYIFVYPNDPLQPSASFEAIRDAEVTRARPADGVVSKQVVTRGSERLHGDLRELCDSSIDAGATLQLAVGENEAAVVFVVEGAVELRDGGARASGAREHTFLLPPATRARALALQASAPSRVLHAVTGPGFGFRRR